MYKIALMKLGSDANFLIVGWRVLDFLLLVPILLFSGVGGVTCSFLIKKY